MLNHHCRRFVGALAALAICFVVAFIPTVAQRNAQRQPDASLKTLTLDGKGGTKRSAKVQAQRPQLTAAQRVTLLKGRVPKLSVRLSTREPFNSHADLMFKNPDEVSAFFDTTSLPSSGKVEVRFNAKWGHLYLLVFYVHPTPDATFTITNTHNGVAQTMSTPALGLIPAYVSAESDRLTYSLTCSKNWMFYSVEVTEL